MTFSPRHQTISPDNHRNFLVDRSMSTSHSQQATYSHQEGIALNESHQPDEGAGMHRTVQLTLQPGQQAQVSQVSAEDDQVIGHRELETTRLSSQMSRPAGGTNKANGAHVTFFLPEEQALEEVEAEEGSENKENEAPDESKETCRETN